MKQLTALDETIDRDSRAHLGLEFRHLRYLVALADAGTFTEAAERMYITQPTMSQQIRRLEEMVGTQLLQRRRDGVQLTSAGSVLLEESRTMLSLLDHGVSRSRQVAGLERPTLRFVLPPELPAALAVSTASRLRSVANAAGVDVTWVEEPLDGEFTLIKERRADAGLGWLTKERVALADPLEVMTVGEFEPEVWVQAAMAARDVIGLAELAELTVMHGPRPTSPATYDAWEARLRAERPGFAFADPPLRHSLPMTLAFAATARRPVAVLTGPRHSLGVWPAPSEAAQCGEITAGGEMTRLGLDRHALTASAVVAWSGDLPRSLQQVLFDTADTVAIAA
jgi:DNA-binding transcriptional LysR family regulator